MTNEHLDDAEIQQYALKKTDCDIYITEHIRHCTSCRAKARQYNLLFERIKQQEKPVFDFSLADLVMAQLPETQRRDSYDNAFFYFAVCIAVFSGCTIFYLFGSNLLSLFSGITPILIYLLITTVTGLLVFLCMDMYRKYLTKMNALKYY